MGVDLPLESLFRTPTVAALAAFVAKETATPTELVSVADQRAAWSPLVEDHQSEWKAAAVLHSWCQGERSDIC